MSNYSFDLENLKGRWIGILSEFGYQVSLKPNIPCPFCGGKDRFHFSDRFGNGTWFCRQCQPDKGSGLTFLERYLNKSKGEVVKMLAERYGTKDKLPQKKEILKQVVSNTDAIIPAPHALQYLPRTYVSIINKHGKPCSYQYERMYAWKTMDDQFIGYIGRQENKVSHQIFWTARGWAQGSLGDNRPLFGLDTLNREGFLYIVEGEKTQNAVSNAFNAACITWTGGTASVTKSDWSIIEGREVILCPDNDAVGMKAMEKVKTYLEGKNDICWFNPPQGLPEGWDLADYEGDDMAAYIEAGTITQKKIIEQEEAECLSKQQELSKQIRPLGFDKETLFFLPAGKLQVIEINSNTLGKGHLRNLADVDIWAGVFPKDSIIDPTNWDQAANWIIRQCEKKGVYNPANIRGNGVWRDNADIVVHMGDHLLVNNVKTRLNEYTSKYIYAQRPRKIQFPQIGISNYEKKLLVNIANQIKWIDKSSSQMILSFILLSPLAAALEWRPSCWVNGRAGSGKSTILQRFIKPCLEGIYLDAEGNTTEAGLRQTIGCDSIPVLFDEPEADSIKSNENAQNVVRLIRSSASSSSASILKGTSAQTALKFQVQCMFLLSSINVVTLQQQDKERIEILELDKDESVDAPWHWANLENLLMLLPDDISAKILHFVITNAEWILQVVKTFRNFVTKRSGSARIGDQYGTLLAGKYILEKEPGGNMPEEAEIAKQIDDQLWSRIKVNRYESNEKDLIAFIAGRIMQIEDVNDGRRKELTIREAISIAAGRAHFFYGGLQKNATDALARRGMKITRRDTVAFQRGNSNLTKMLQDKPAFANYMGILKRVEGSNERRIRYGNTQFHCVEVPLATFLEQDWAIAADKDNEDEENLTKIDPIVDW